MLRNTALSLAARETIELDLTPAGGLCSALMIQIQQSVANAHTVVFLGASTPGLVSAIISGTEAHKKTITVIEPELDRIGACKADIKTPMTGSITLLCGEPLNLRGDPRVADELVRATNPGDYTAFRAIEGRIEEYAAAAPLIPDSSVDLVVLDMLANRLSAWDTGRVLAEAFRVLRRGGQVLLAAMLSDEEIQTDGDIDFGAWRAKRLPLEAEPVAELAGAGFYGMTYHEVLARPVCLTKGVEVRAFLVDGFKGKQGVCLDQGHAVIYRGPWHQVLDDDGHLYARGERAAVCAKTYELLMRPPYQKDFVGLPAYVAIDPNTSPLFDCNTPARRDPRITKGIISLTEARSASSARGDDAKCC